MEKDILSEVIEVEKDIQKSLDEEKVKARTWLEQVKEDSAQELAREEINIKASLNEAIEVARKNAELKAAEIVKQAQVKAERFRKLTDDALNQIIGRQLNRILPG